MTVKFMINKLNNLLANLPNHKRSEIGGVSLVKEAFSQETILNYHFGMAILSESSFHTIFFNNNNFYGSYFFECQFHNCIFTKTIFSKAEWSDCTFINCQFDECVFERTEVDTTIFQSCNFTNVNFIGSSIYECTFQDCLFKKLKTTPNKTLLMCIINSKFYKEKDQKTILLNNESDFLKILNEMKAF